MSLLQCDGGVHTVIHGFVVEPTAGDGFGLGVELHDLLAVWAQVTQFRATRAGEAEGRNRYRDWDVNTNLADIDLALELASSSAALSEQTYAITEWVGVYQLDRVIQGFSFQYHEHRAEDFLGVDVHLSGHTRE